MAKTSTKNRGQSKWQTQLNSFNKYNKNILIQNKKCCSLKNNHNKMDISVYL